MKYKTLEEFLELQSRLLDLEHKTEVSEQKVLYESLSLKHLENNGVCIRHMHVEHQKTGLYGRFLLTFTRTRKEDEKEDKDGNNTSSHRLTSGDIVGVYPNKGGNSEELSSGVVSYVRGTSITIAFNEDFDVSLYPMYRLMLLTNEVTYKRLKRALDGLRKLASSSPCSSIVDVLFPCHRVDQEPCSRAAELKYFNENLDASQKGAVDFVLHNEQRVSVIHGPPGTGKTTTVVEVVHQAVKQYSSKVLVCAPSNIAVDNLLDRLSRSGLKVIRLGHPARVVVELQKYSLDATLTNRDSSDIITGVRSEISSTIGRLKKCKNKSEVVILRREIKELKKELRTRESKAMKEVLTNADVVLSTTNSASGDGPLKHLAEDHFDLLIIDEAAQAMEMSCWIPMMLSPRLILVGDHKQLPPTIISHQAANDGLAHTLLERVVEGLGDKVVSMLTTQYRMHEDIMCWPSKQLYDNKLVAAESVAKHLLCDLDGVKKTADTSAPLVFVDTAGLSMFECEVEEDQSKANSWEADIVKDHIEALVQAGLSAKLIGIITPYNLQVKVLRKCINVEYPGVEIRSVDGFQGREKEAILISMVRSNEKGEIGFLSEDRRMNVALTRARRHLFVVGDSQTASHNPFLKSMCKYLQNEGDLRFPHNVVAMDTQTATEEYQIPDLFDEKMRYKNVKKEHKKEKNKENNKENNGACDVADRVELKPTNYFKEIEVAGTEDHVGEGSSKDHSNDDAAISDHSRPIRKAVDTDAIFRQIEEFSTSIEGELVFPCSLSAKERAFVHEMSDQFGLTHISCGEGISRRIVVSKMDSSAKTEMDALKLDIEKIKIDGHVVCENCSVYVPGANYELHLIRCRKAKRAEELRKKDNEEIKKSAAKKKSSKNKNQEEKKEEEEDIDSLLDSFAKSNSRCNFPKCKIPIKTLGQKCYFCSQMYCLSHHQAEVHGCGAAAKVKARQDISKYKGHIPSKMNEVKKAQVQHKLNAKLSKLEEQRLKKKNEKD